MKNIIYLACALHIGLCSAILPFWMTLFITAGMFFARYWVIGNLTTNPKAAKA
jgi:hypothetical protein